MTTYTDIQYLHTHDDVESTSSEATYPRQTTTLSGFVPGRRYWVLARSSISSSSVRSTGGVCIDLYDATNGQQMTGSYGIRHPQNVSHYQQWSYSVVFTAGSSDGSSGSIHTRLSVEDASMTGRQDDTTITALDITDLVEGRDYFYVENTTAANNSTTYARRADITIDVPADGAMDGDWAVYGFAKVDLNNTAGNENSMTALSITHDTTTQTPETSNEPESATEFVNGVLGRVCTLATSTSTSARFSLLTKDAAANASPHQHEVSTLFGLRLSTFRTHGKSYTEAANQSTSTSFVTTDTVASIDHVDPDDNKYMVLAMGVFAAESTGRNVKWQINQASTSISDFDVYTNGVSSDRSHDGADETPFALMIPTTVADGSDSNTFILQYKKDSSAEYGVKDTGIAVFRLQVPSNVYEWDGSAGDGSVVTAANWTPSGIPRQHDKVIFNTGSVDCTSGGTVVKTVHVAGSYSGTITSGATLGFVRMNITTQGATVKLTTGDNGRYLNGVALKPSVYMTNASLVDGKTKITAGSAGADAYISGALGKVELDSDNWNRVVVSDERIPSSVFLNGNVVEFVATGRTRLTTTGTITSAWIAGRTEWIMTDGLATAAYISSPGSVLVWQSDDTNGVVHLYEGMLDLTEATNNYNSSGLHVWGDSTLDTRTGINGFKSPTIEFRWHGGRQSVWRIDDGQTVAIS